MSYLFGSDVRKEDSALGNAAFLLGVFENVGLPDGGEPEEPEHRVGDALQNATP